MVKGLEQLVVTALVAMLLVVGCATEPAGDKSGALADCSTQEPPADTPSGEQIRLTVSKEVARPGEELSIRVEADPTTKVMRGVDAYLECWSGKDWVTKFVMILKTDGGANKPTVGPYPLPPNTGIISLGLIGPGPEPVKLPDELKVGWYRIRKQIGVEGPIVDPRTIYATVQVVN